MEQIWYLLLKNDGTPHCLTQPNKSNLHSVESVQYLKFAIRDDNIAIMTMFPVANIKIYRSRSEYESNGRALRSTARIPNTTQDEPAVVVLPKMRRCSLYEFSRRRRLEMESTTAARFLLSEIVEWLATMFYSHGELRLHLSWTP